MRVWIDIENPPQVRYLLPCRSLLERQGHEVIVTAREDGATFALLEDEGVPFEPIGRLAGRTKWTKIPGVLGRARALSSFVGAAGRPAVLLSASRPAVLAAWRHRLPAFYIGDYEFADLTVQRFSGTYLLFPDVIDPAVFRRRGMRPDRLIPFRGLKEDISFAGLALEAIEPHRFAEPADSIVTLLFRAPSETSHYQNDESVGLASALLEFLADEDSVQVVFSPRSERQTRMLEQHAWRRPPVILREPLHFVSLLKGVDLVVSAGGTMVREAAYLGMPAYSIFRGRVGAVDRHLASLGRLRFIASPTEFAAIRLERKGPLRPLTTNPLLREQLVECMTRRLVALRRFVGRY